MARACCSIYVLAVLETFTVTISMTHLTVKHFVRLYYNLKLTFSLKLSENKLADRKVHSQLEMEKCAAI